jgi:hypothetical protein
MSSSSIGAGKSVDLPFNTASQKPISIVQKNEKEDRIQSLHYQRRDGKIGYPNAHEVRHHKALHQKSKKEVTQSPIESLSSFESNDRSSSVDAQKGTPPHAFNHLHWNNDEPLFHMDDDFNFYAISSADQNPPECDQPPPSDLQWKIIPGMQEIIYVPPLHPEYIWNNRKVDVIETNAQEKQCRCIIL